MSSSPAAAGGRRVSVWHTHHGRRAAQEQWHTAVAEYKAGLSALWSSSAGPYTAEHTALLQPLISHFVSLVHRHVGGSSKAAILDVASGGGEPALSIAQALPCCNVISTDMALGMVDHARRRAEQMRGLTNFRAMAADAEELPMFPSGSFNVITCCAGLMFLPDHEKALREWRRVLAPGGLLIAAVTGRPDQMQVSELVGPMLSVLRPEDKPLCVANPRPFGGVTRLLRSLARARFRDVRSREFNVPMRIARGRAADFVLANPVIAELLPRLDGADARVLLQAAESRMVAAARQWGYLRPDGSIVLGTNVYTVLTASAQR